MTLHQQIEEALLNNQHGWASNEKAADLAALVVAMGGGTVLELGVYCGRSLFPMALAVRHCGNGIAIGVDPFSVEASTEGEEKQHVDWWKTVNHNWVENTFREKLAELELEDWTLIHKAKSDDVEPPKELTVAHVDANHAEQCLRDVSRFCPNIILGGFAVLDDLKWTSGAVSQSVQILEELGFVMRRRVLGKEVDSIYENDYGIWQRTKMLDSQTALSHNPIHAP